MLLFKVYQRSEKRLTFVITQVLALWSDPPIWERLGSACVRPPANSEKGQLGAEIVASATMCGLGTSSSRFFSSTHPQLRLFDFSHGKPTIGNQTSTGRFFPSFAVPSIELPPQTNTIDWYLFIAL